MSKTAEIGVTNVTGHWTVSKVFHTVDTRTQEPVSVSTQMRVTSKTAAMAKARREAAIISREGTFEVTAITVIEFRTGQTSRMEVFSIA